MCLFITVVVGHYTLSEHSLIIPSRAILVMVFFGHHTKAKHFNHACIWKQIDGGWRHTVALDDDGQLYGWGWNKVTNTYWKTSCTSVLLFGSLVIQLKVLTLDCRCIYHWVCFGAHLFLSEMTCLRLQFGQVGCGNTDDQNSPKAVIGIDNQVNYGSQKTSSLANTYLFI